MPAGAASTRSRSLQRTYERIEAGVGSRRGTLLLFGAAVVVFSLESVALPVIPGRDFGTYLRYYAQMWDWHSVWPMTMLYRTPIAPLVVGLPLDVVGGWGAEIVMTILFAASVVAWTFAALPFGRRTALLTALALLLFPGYTILFHTLSSDPIAAAAIAGWALALTRAASRPSASRFAHAGAAAAVTALARPGNQVLVVCALLPLVLAIPWRRRLISAASCLAAAMVVLGGWAINNGVRYGDYAVARGTGAFLPFYRAFTTDHIVAPDNGPASRRLARVVQTRLLTQEPYRSYVISLQSFFAHGSPREFEDAVGLSDRYWGWDSDYSILRKVGLEAVRTHPGAYARGVGHTIFEELWHPLFVALPGSEEARAGAVAAAQSTGVAAKTIPAGLPVPSGGGPIPAGHQSFDSTTPDGHIHEVWTSPTAHRVVFSTSSGQRRYDAVGVTVDRLTRRVPPYPGSSWLTLQLSRSSKLFPPGLLWLAVGLVGMSVRRPRNARVALFLALSALTVVVVSSLSIYPIIEFAVPVVPALIVFGAVGLVGERRPARPLPS